MAGCDEYGDEAGKQGKPVCLWAFGGEIFSKAVGCLVPARQKQMALRERVCSCIVRNYL